MVHSWYQLPGQWEALPGLVRSAPGAGSLWAPDAHLSLRLPYISESPASPDVW